MNSFSLTLEDIEVDYMSGTSLYVRVGDRERHVEDRDMGVNESTMLFHLVSQLGGLDYRKLSVICMGIINSSVVNCKFIDDYVEITDEHHMHQPVFSGGDTDNFYYN